MSAAEGRNFFTQVAPCTNNRLMFGKFKDGVSKGELDSEFNYTITYKMKPTNVQIRLYRHAPVAAAEVQHAFSLFRQAEAVACIVSPAVLGIVELDEFGVLEEPVLHVLRVALLRQIG